MAEHEEFNFEHGLKAKFEQLDAQIKIPEIPDAQGIFDRAEEQKGRVIPFKKYSRYIAVAAAVALICVSIPVMGMLGGFKLDLSANNEAAPETAREGDYYMYDAASSETAAEAAEEEIEAPQATEPETHYSAVSSSMAAAEQETVDSDSFNCSNEANPGEMCELPIVAALRAYFEGEGKDKLEDEKTVNTGSDDVRSIEDNINKKRHIEITLGEESVSVVLTDTAADEAVTVFWVEGIYQESYLDETTGNYVITAVKSITKKDFESEDFYPMGSDTEHGKFIVSGINVSVPEKVTEGAIYLKIEIHPGTGEYEINGELK